LNYRVEAGSNEAKTGWNLSLKTIENPAFSLYSQWQDLARGGVIEGADVLFARAQREAIEAHRNDSIFAPVFWAGRRQMRPR
jgi:hypothetical protein